MSLMKRNRLMTCVAGVLYVFCVMTVFSGCNDSSPPAAEVAPDPGENAEAGTDVGEEGTETPSRLTGRSSHRKYEQLTDDAVVDVITLCRGSLHT